MTAMHLVVSAEKGAVSNHSPVLSCSAETGVSVSLSVCVLISL